MVITNLNVKCKSDVLQTYRKSSNISRVSNAKARSLIYDSLIVLINAGAAIRGLSVYFQIKEFRTLILTIIFPPYGP